MRYTGPKEKLSRKIGENLGLKAERSFSPKSAFLKKPYRPGMHGKSRRRALSEFGTQLIEKQKIKFTYGITERQLKKYFDKAKKQKGITGNLLLSMLEKRLDNTLFRAGLAPSRIASRQLASHGHFLVNGKKVTIPSLGLKAGDVVAIRPQSKNKSMFVALSEKLKKHEVPSWIMLDKKSWEVTIKAKPNLNDLPKNFNMSTIIAYYSR